MNNKAKTVIRRALVGFVCFWFAAVVSLYIFQRVMVLPALDRLEYPVQERELKQAALNAGDLYLMGLRMKFPPEGLTPGSAVPFFTAHRLETIAVFLARGNAPAGNVIISASPDDAAGGSFPVPPAGSVMSKVLFPDASAYALIDRMHRAKAAEFSWWNGIYDARLVYVLYLKSITTPVWYHSGSIYHVKTPYYSGYLAEGSYGEDRGVAELTFAENGTLYRVTILAGSGQDFTGLLSTVRTAGGTEAEEIIRGYSQQVVSRDLVLASRISRHVDVRDLEELLGLIEKRKSAGEKTVTAVNPLKAEIEYLKSRSK